MKLFGAAALLALLAGAAWAGGGGGAPGGAPPAVPVKAEPVETREVRAGRTFVGNVEPARRSTVGSEFAGLVVSYGVREGDRVDEGQELARLRTTMLDLNIAVEEARLGQAREKLRELESGSRPEEIRQAKAQLDQLDAEVALRAWQLEAAERLFRQNTISEDERREAELAYDASKLRRAAQKAALDLVEAGPREERIAQARAEIAIQEARLAELAEERERYVIRAPFAGWVVRELTEVGQWLSTGAPVAEIVYLDEVDVVVQVVEDFAPRLARGQQVRVAFDAFPDRIFTGPVHRIVPQADLRGRTFPVIIRLENEIQGGEPLLRAGMFAEAVMSVGTDQLGLFVPKDAIVLGGPQPVVWAVGEDGTARPVPVILGVAEGEQVEVRGSLEAGTPVVTRGNERLRGPSQVTILPE